MIKIFIGVTAILLFLVSSCKSHKISNTSDTDKDIPKISNLVWQVQDYKNTSLGAMRNIIVLSKNEIYAYNTKEVYVLNGNESEKIFESKDRIEAIN